MRERGWDQVLARGEGASGNLDWGCGVVEEGVCRKW